MRQWQPLLSALSRRVGNLVARAVVRMTDNTTRLQQLQVSLQAQEVRTVERFQPYGLSGVPLAGAEAVVLFPVGLRDHAIAIAVDDRRFRPTTDEEGEVRVYNHLNIYVRLKNDGSIEVVANTQVDVTAPEAVFHCSGKVRIDAPMLECTGEIKDRCDSDGKTMEQMRSVFDAHNHGNVQNGGGVTAGPNPTIG